MINGITTGIKTIGIIIYVFAGLSLLFGIGQLIVIPSLLENAPIGFSMGEILIGLLIGPIFNLGLAVLFYFVGKYLLKGKKWARVALIIISALGILFGLVFVISPEQVYGSDSSLGSGFGICLIVFWLVILIYLFSRNVRNYFR